MRGLKSLVDENIARSVVDYFSQEGYDVIIAREEFPGREDLQLPDFAYRDNRIIVTMTRALDFLFIIKNCQQKVLSFLGLQKRCHPLNGCFTNSPHPDAG